MLRVKQKGPAEEIPAQAKILSGIHKLTSAVLSLLFLLTLCLVQPAKAVHPQNRPPESRWRGEWLTASPSRQGFDIDRLEDAVRRIGEMNGVYSFILVRNGYIVVERYFREGYRTKPHNLKSASKSVLSALIGIAIEDGYMSLDQPVAEILPRIKSLDDPRRERITVRHLLTMTSGLDPTSYDAYNIWVSNQDWVTAALDRSLISEPGTRFQYSTGNSHILSGVLTAATGTSTLEFAEQKLFAPLGIKVRGWATDPSGIYQGGNNLSLIPRDMAKIGQLYLDGGRFGNRQVVPGWWVDESTRLRDLGPHDVYGKYGYSWYVNPGGKKAFVAVGFGGQYIYVSPVRDCVIVVTSTLRSKGRAWEKTLFNHLQTGVLGSVDVKGARVIHAAADDPESIRDAPGDGGSPGNASGSKAADRNGAEGESDEGPGSGKSISRRMGRATTNIILRSQPNRKSSKIGVVDSGERLAILETEGKWHRVISRNREGWIHGGYVSFGSGISGKAGDNAERAKDQTAVAAHPPPTPDPSQTAAFAGDHLKAKSGRTKTRVNIRTGPGTSYAVIHVLEPSAAFTLEDQSGSWLRVHAGRYEGWVNGDYVTLAALPEPDKMALKTSPPETSRVSSDPEAKEARKRFETELLSTREEINGLQKKLEESRKTGETLGAELALARDETASLKQAAQAAQSGREKLVKDLLSVRQEIGNLTSAVERAGADREALRTELTSARQEIDVLRKSLAGSETGRETLERELASARAEIDQVRGNLQVFRADREKLNAKLSSTSQEITGLQEALQESRAAGEKLSAEVVRRDNEAKTGKAAAAKAEASHAALETELAGAQKEIETLRAVVGKGQADRERVNAELSSAQQKIGGLQKELQESRATGEKLFAEVTRLDKELKARTAAAIKSEASRASLNKELSSTRGEIDGLKKAAQASRATGEKLLAEVARLDNEAKTGKAAAAKAEASHTALDTELAGARRETERLNAAIQEARTERERLGSELAETRAAMGGLKTEMQKALVSERSSARRQIDRLEWELERAQKNHKSLLAATNRIQQDGNRSSGNRESPEPVPGPSPPGEEPSPAQPGQDGASNQGATAGKAVRESKTPGSFSESDAGRPSRNLLTGRPEAVPVDTFVESWAAAWSRRDVAGYLSHYSPKFQPGSGESRDEWRRQRKKRLEGPSFIEVYVNGIEKTMTGENRASVTFQQEYRSDTHVDRAIKTLDLTWENNGWKIIRETSRTVK